MKIPFVAGSIALVALVYWWSIPPLRLEQTQLRQDSESVRLRIDKMRERSLAIRALDQESSRARVEKVQLEQQPPAGPAMVDRS